MKAKLRKTWFKYNRFKCNLYEDFNDSKFMPIA